MITKADRNNLVRDFSKIFATKDELKGITQKIIKYVDARFDALDSRLEPLERFEKIIEETNHKLIEFKDAIMGEIVTMREELAITLGHRDILEDHDTRITKLEEKRSKPN